MKISQINIKDYNQFKNLMLDLIYPKGHQKEGASIRIFFLLDKVVLGKRVY